MTQIRNVCPRGALDVPLLGVVVDVDEVVDVTTEQATVLLEQVDVWQPADDDAHGLTPAALAPAVELAEPDDEDLDELYADGKDAR